jgi:hypothetical protein
MATEIVSTILETNLGQEIVTVMDDYGNPYLAQIAVSLSTERAALITAAKALMDANQAVLETYASANGHDISAQKTAGQAKRAALQKLNNITTL